MKKEIAVEPLVGHMRHPYGVKECVPEGNQVGNHLPARLTLGLCQGHPMEVPVSNLLAQSDGK